MLEQTSSNTLWQAYHSVMPGTGKDAIVLNLAIGLGKKWRHYI